MIDKIFNLKHGCLQVQHHKLQITNNGPPGVPLGEPTSLKDSGTAREAQGGCNFSSDDQSHSEGFSNDPQTHSDVTSHLASETPASVSECENPYSSREHLWKIVRTKNVKLIKPTYFIHLCERGLPMAKSQDLPQEFVLDVDGSALNWDNLVIIAISYCWITKDHPDPDGYHVETLYHLFRRFIAGSWATAKEH